MYATHLNLAGWPGPHLKAKIGSGPPKMDGPAPGIPSANHDTTSPPTPNALTPMSPGCSCCGGAATGAGGRPKTCPY